MMAKGRTSGRTRRCAAAIAGSLALMLACGPAAAVEPGEVLADPRLEARARALSAELRCLVCQNQSIDDSNAPLAKDLRVLVRERLVAGDSDAGVLSFVRARYGDFVLLRPPFSWRTAVLWLTPLLLLAGIGVYAVQRRRRPETAAGPALSAAEERRLAELLATADNPPARKPK